MADVRFGIKTGINEFFHLDDEKIKRWGIEEEFLRPIVTSLREISEPSIKPDKVRYSLFKCHQEKEVLRKKGKIRALRYIEHGQKQITSGRGRVGQVDIPYPEVPSVKHRKLWYDVGDRIPGELMINRFVGERFFFPVNIHNLMISDTFFECKFPKQDIARLYQAALNSTLVYLFGELTGRITWAQGVLYLYGPELRALLTPDLRTTMPAFTRKLNKAFSPIFQRPIKTIFEEVKMSDRKKLDRLVLKALGLEPEKYLKRIYDGLTELVRERLDLAKMRKKVKKARFEKDLDKIREGVIEKVLPDGPKKFPEEFLPVIVKRREFGEISVPAEPLELGEYFMGTQEVINDAGFCYKADSVDEAKFIIYAQRPDEFIVKVPKSELALSKAVKSYEKYLRELRKDLYKEAYNRTFDLRQAETMTRRIFGQFGVRWLG